MSSTAGENFPVLTEVLIPGQLPSAGRIASPVATANPATPPRSSDDQWEALERDVREAVLKGLQARFDLVLEQRLKDTLSQLLDQVLTGMTAELKTSLRETMRDVVSRAVTQEISRVRATRVR